MLGFFGGELRAERGVDLRQRFSNFAIASSNARSRRRGRCSPADESFDGAAGGRGHLPRDASNEMSEPARADA